MTTAVPKAVTIAALRDTWASIRALLADLPADAWSTPTPLPGWDVRANVAHIIGTEAMLAGDPSPDAGDELKELGHVRNDIGAFNEAWVVALRDAPPDDMLARFDDLTARRLATLEAMSDDEWNAESFTPAGKDSYGRFMRIRVFDCWMHEQDMRDAVGRPGHESGPAVELALDEMAVSMGFVVGKRAGAPDGTSVTFDLTGASGRSIHVLVEGRAWVVDALPGPASATLTMPVGVFTRRGGGRIDASTAAAATTLDGDTDLGGRVIDQLNYTI